jgi:hypothetical protein
MLMTRALMMDASDMAARVKTGPDPASSHRPPMCYYCSSTDTMEPFRRPERVFLVTRLFPRIRARYCRHCTRHFLCIAPRPSRTGRALSQP